MANAKYYARKKKNSVAEYLIMLTVVLIVLCYVYERYLLNIVCVCLFLAVVLWQLCKVYAKKSKQNRYLKSSLYEIDHLSGVQFEEWLKAYFEIRGYTAKLTATTGDYGADVIIKDRKTHECIAVQAKRYNKNIGIAAVQQVIGAKEYYHADKVAVATNQYFTPAAKKLAAANNVELWDRDYFWEK